MIDIQLLREDPKKYKKAAKDKGYDVDIDELLRRDKSRRELTLKVEELRRQRNELATKSKGNKPTSDQISDGKKLKDELSAIENTLKETEKSWLELLKQVPNLPVEDVPIGENEDQNVVVKEWGKRTDFDFTPKNHWQIGEIKGWIDKERAAKVSGSRFAYIKGDLVKLQWAVLQFALDALTDQTVIEALIKENNLKLNSKPFTPVLPPLVLKTDIYDAMDRLEPRDERYKIEGEELWLQGSAEHVLGSMHADEIFNEDDLPLRYVGFATSFRKEAGSYGKDMEGIFRMHQFDKLEAETLSTPETSFDEHLLMIALQEYLMQKLELPYRLVNKCTGDIGKPNARGWDLDVWLPGQNKYRETHTADYMTDYQTRRLHTRLRRKKNGAIVLAHTNDATVLSMRPLIAIIENNQTIKGDVIIPKVLQQYMGGREEI